METSASNHAGVAFTSGGSIGSTAIPRDCGIVDARQRNAGLGCSQCRDLQRQLMDFSAQNARAHTRAREARKAASGAEAEMAAASTAAASLRGGQVVLQSRLKRIEDEVVAVRQERSAAESKWREEARARQHTYDEAKAASSQQRVAQAEAEEEVLNVEMEAQQLRKALDEASLDVEDARAACVATESRVARDSVQSAQAVAEARLAAEEAHEEAEAAGAAELVARSRLEMSGRNLDELRAEATAEDHRCAQLELELTAARRRIEAGHDARRRLRQLGHEARLKLEGAQELDRRSSPRTKSADMVATWRQEVEEGEQELRRLEEERQQLKQSHRKDIERRSARLERLRAKVEMYYAGREELRRLYEERSSCCDRSFAVARPPPKLCDDDIDFEQSDDASCGEESVDARRVAQLLSAAEAVEKESRRSPSWERRGVGGVAGT